MIQLLLLNKRFWWVRCIPGKGFQEKLLALSFAYLHTHSFLLQSGLRASSSVLDLVCDARTDRLHTSIKKRFQFVGCRVSDVMFVTACVFVFLKVRSNSKRSRAAEGGVGAAPHRWKMHCDWSRPTCCSMEPSGLLQRHPIKRTEDAALVTTVLICFVYAARHHTQSECSC